MMDLLEKDLRDLGRVRAPEGFSERVLVAVGLVPGGADAYAELETPVGILYVAWNDEGVSAVRLPGPATTSRAGSGSGWAAA
jgi:hypothetical protein